MDALGIDSYHFLSEINNRESIHSARQGRSFWKVGENRRKVTNTLNAFSIAARTHPSCQQKQCCLHFEFLPGTQMLIGKQLKLKREILAIGTIDRARCVLTIPRGDYPRRPCVQ